METTQESLSQDTLNKLSYILSQDKNIQTANDFVLKYQLKVFFIQKGSSYEFIFKENIHLAKIVTNIVNILFLVFQKEITEREAFYNMSMLNLPKEGKFFDIINDLKSLQPFDINFKGREKLEKLFQIISEALYLKNQYSFLEYIESIFFNLSFVPGLELLLKYHLFSLIHKYYLEPLQLTLDYNESNINTSDDISLDILIGLFSESQNDFDSLIKSIVFLNYGLIKNSIKNYNYKDVIYAIERMHSKYKNIKDVGNMVLCEEKIMTIFCDELRRPKNKRTKKKNKKSKKKTDDEEIPKKEKEIKIDTNTNSIQLNAQITTVNDGKTASKKIGNKYDKNDKNNDMNNKNILSQIEKINNYFNNFEIYINKNIMGNEDMKTQIEELHKLILGIADENKQLKEDNDRMKGKIGEMEGKMGEMDGKIKEMNSEILKLNKENINKQEDIAELKENIENLRDEYEEIKDILGNIQCRDLSKNFLRAFQQYLTDNDWKKIREDKSKRGNIISNRIAKLFPNANKQKMELIINLVKRASDLILDGNYFAHSLTLEKYKEEFEAYKIKKKVKEISSPLALCFVINLGLSDDLFDNAYLFLKKFFNFYLKADDNNDLLELYFN